jgi:hypothetical protein
LLFKFLSVLSGISLSSGFGCAAREFAPFRRAEVS